MFGMIKKIYTALKDESECARHLYDLIIGSNSLKDVTDLAISGRKLYFSYEGCRYSIAFIMRKQWMESKLVINETNSKINDEIMIKAWDQKKFYKKSDISKVFMNWSEVMAFSGDSKLMFAIED